MLYYYGYIQHYMVHIYWKFYNFKTLDLQSLSLILVCMPLRELWSLETLHEIAF